MTSIILTQGALRDCNPNHLNPEVRTWKVFKEGLTGLSGEIEPPDLLTIIQGVTVPVQTVPCHPQPHKVFQ